MNKVYIIGYYGYSNAGDDAMLLGICTELTRRNIEHTNYTSGDSLTKILSNIIHSDIVALGGGTHLRNWGKGWLKQGLRIILLACFVRLLGKQFHMWNVGIDGEKWEWLARRVSNFISIRDKETFDSCVLASWPEPSQKDKKIIGINITPLDTIYHNNYNKDVASWGLLLFRISMWLSTRPNWTVRFVSLNCHPKYSDNLIEDDIFASILRGYLHGHEVEFIAYNNPQQAFLSIAECTIFLGMRYHSVVFSYIAGGIYVKLSSYPSTANFHYIPVKEAIRLAREGIKTE